MMPRIVGPGNGGQRYVRQRLELNGHPRQRDIAQECDLPLEILGRAALLGNLRWGY